MTDPRLVKYAGPSGRCTPLNVSLGLGCETEGFVRLVALGREVDLAGDGLYGGGQISRSGA